MSAATGKVAPQSVDALVGDLTNSSGSAAPQSTTPNTDNLVLLPAGLVGNILGGFAGIIGKGIGSLAGNERLGEDIGNTASPFLKLLPWTVVPAGVAPQGAGPEGAQESGPAEDMILVPAGVVADVFSGFAGAIGYGVGGLAGNRELGEKIGKAAAPFIKMLPWSVLPAEVLPQSATPGGAKTGPSEDLMFVPAGLFGNIVSGFAEVIGKGVGGLAGNSKLGGDIGKAASPFLKMLPWSVVPAGVAPQSADPSGAAIEGPDQDLMLVPAGIFGALLGGWGGSLAGKAIGGLFGNKELGEKIGGALGGVAGGIVPFTVVPVAPSA